MSDLGARELILREATLLFGEKGYGATSIRDIAKAAGVTNPTLYYHFGNKEGLYRDTVRVHTDEMYELLVAVVESKTSVRERITAYVQTHLDQTSSNRAGMRLLMYANQYPRTDVPQVDLMASHIRTNQLLENLLKEGVSNGELRADTHILEGNLAISGITVLGSYAKLQRYPLPEDLSERIVDTLFRGIGVHQV